VVCDTTFANRTAVPFSSVVPFIIEPLKIDNVFQADRRPYERPQQQQAGAMSLMAISPHAHHDLTNAAAGANLVAGTQRRHNNDQQYGAPGGGLVVDGTVTASSTTMSDQYSGLLILHEAAKRLHPVMRPLLSTTTASCTTSSMADQHGHQHDQHLQSAITVDPLPFESVFSMGRIQE
jgi:hypothetical protein